MKHNITPAVLLEVAVAAAVTLYSGVGVSRKVNRIAQALERGVAALERMAGDVDVLVTFAEVYEIHYPMEKSPPRSAILHPADLKPISGPDPTPCTADQFTCSDLRRSSSKEPDCRDPHGVPVACPGSMPTLGGTARE